MNQQSQSCVFVTASRVDGDVAVFEGIERRFVGKSEIREEGGSTVSRCGGIRAGRGWLGSQRFI